MRATTITPLRTRRPNRLAKAVAVLLLGVSATTLEMPAEAVDPVPDNAPTAGDELVIDYYAEPEYLLTAGTERWNVRNTPDGTMASAYGVPEGAVHDLYAKSGRYEPLASAPAAELLDVSVRSAAPAFGLEHSWAFVRKSDGNAEIWGPADEAFPERYVLDLGEDIAGGTVLSDTDGAPSAVVITEPGQLWKMTPGTTSTPLGPVAQSGETVVAAVARDHTEYATPAINTNTPRPSPPGDLDRGELVPGTSANPPEIPGQLLILFSSGRFELAPIDGDVTDVASLGSRPIPDSEQFDGALLAATPNPIVDFDYSCFKGEYNLTGDANGSVTATLAPFDGAVGEALACPPGGDAVARLTGGGLDLGPARGMGRVSVGVGLTDVGGAHRVDVVHSGDTALFGLSGFATFATATVSDHAAGVACERSPAEPVRAGTFDVRVVFATTYVACVRVDPADADRAEITTLISPVPGGNALRQCTTDCETFRPPQVVSTSSTTVQRKTFDRLAGPTASSSPDDPIVETYTDLEALSVQVEFPCERLLGRPLGSGLNARFFDCASNRAYAAPSTDPRALPASYPESSPNGVVAYAIAGYGQVEGERRLFVDHQTDAELFRVFRDQGIFEDAQQAGVNPSIPPAPDPSDLAWVVEPSPYLASDLSRVYADPLGVDPSTIAAYAPPATGTPPPVLLTQIPNDLRTPLRIRIDSATPRLEERASIPIAVLQAPPTVAGLGQQTDFTPEFASTRSSSTETTNSKSTSAGNHVDVEFTMTAGGGFLGNNARTGGGFAAGYSFMAEAEESLVNDFEVATSEGFGGAFDDHTVVTRSSLQYVWDATMLEDPSGFGTGKTFEYAIPAGEVTQSVPLATLAAESPGLYGVGGAFRPTIDAIVGTVEIGNPASYPAGASSSQPTTVLRRNGGPCNGGYASADEPSKVDGRLRPIVDLGNPYLPDDLDPPVGPDVVVSAPHVVSTGNGLTESAAITLSSSTSESRLTSRSHDWSATGIFKTESESSTGASIGLELTISGGVDSGFTTSGGVSDTLGEGSGLSTVMGNIPLSSTEYPWVEDEQYTWRMYMCKAQLGPVALGTEIWVQGYVVDGYAGSGGLEDLAAVDAVAPVAAAVAFADPATSPAGTVDDCAAVGPRDNRFVWDQASGTIDRYSIEFTNVSGGGGDQRIVADLVAPSDFDPVADRKSCAAVPPGDFVDGDLYRWRAVTDGFIGDQATSDWEYFRPQVWPPDQTLSLRTPIVHPDDSVTIDIDDPPGVTSLRHDITVYRIDPVSGARTEVAAAESIVSGSYRTPTLPAGRYEADVVGHNGHESGGVPVTTPVATVEFDVEETLRAQFTYGGCSEDPCNTTDEIEFTDASLPASGVPIVDWRWTFGDGTTSTDQNPTHRFADLPTDGSSTYDVFLVVTDALGQTDSARETVVLQSAAPELTTDDVPAEAALGEGFEMTVSASDPDNDGRDPADLQIPTIEWDLDDDGNADVSDDGFESSVTHSFDTAGDHPVTVTATDPLGRTDTETFVVTVHAPPTANFSHSSCDVGAPPNDPTCALAGESVAFDPATSSTTTGELVAWEWDLGDGDGTIPVATPADPIVETEYPGAGDYDASLRVQDRLGQWSEPAVRTLRVVADDAGPVFDTASDQRFVAEPGDDAMIVDFVEPTATDDSGSVTVTCSPGSGSVLPVGDTTVTCTASDPTGNMAGTSFVVSVDATPATALEARATATNADAITFDVTFSTEVTGFTAADVLLGGTAGADTVVVEPDAAPGTAYVLTISGMTTDGTVDVTIPAGVAVATNVSAEGNTASPTVRVDYDVTPLEIVAPTGAGAEFETDPGAAGAVVNYDVDAVEPGQPAADRSPTESLDRQVDVEPGNTVDCSPPSGSFFPIGTTTVTCTAADAAGNETTATFDITVIDTEAPRIDDVDDRSFTLPSGVSSDVYEFSPPTASDNSESVDVACDPASGSMFDLGSTTVTCTATDPSGNTASTSFDVVAEASPGPVQELPQTGGSPLRLVVLALVVLAIGVAITAGFRRRRIV